MDCDSFLFISEDFTITHCGSSIEVNASRLNFIVGIAATTTGARPSLWRPACQKRTNMNTPSNKIHKIITTPRKLQQFQFSSHCMSDRFLQEYSTRCPRVWHLVLCLYMNIHMMQLKSYSNHLKLLKKVIFAQLSSE